MYLSILEDCFGITSVIYLLRGTLFKNYIYGYLHEKFMYEYYYMKMKRKWNFHTNNGK